LDEFFNAGQASGSRKDEYLDEAQVDPLNQEFFSRDSKRLEDLNLPQDIIMSNSNHKQAQPFEYRNSRSRTSGTFLEMAPPEGEDQEVTSHMDNYSFQVESKADKEKYFSSNDVINRRIAKAA